jgi:hypothetical protein
MEGSVREQLGKWLATGRDENFLLEGLQATLAKSWLAKHSEVMEERELLQDYIAQSVDKHGSWWRKKDICSWCDETFRLENMEICCDCLTTLCWKHKDISYLRQSDGSCRCGGEFY